MAASSSMLFANFNQDFSCISIGTKRGYSITNCDPFGRVYTMNDGARGIVEMLFCTSLIALVGAADHAQSSPRKLQIVNTKRQSMICELLFPSSILAVKMNRKTLVIVLETEIYIYDISNMRLLHVIETTSNPDAICALSPSADNSYLAYPSPVPSSSANPTAAGGPSPPTPSGSQSGDVLLFSTRSLTVSNVIQAHKSPLSFLALNSTGTLLATSSDKGTVIRVWSVPGAEKLYQFRRGTREAKICSINFNLVSSLVCVSSMSGTVHIFKLGKQGSGGGAASSSSKALTGLPTSGGGRSSPPESITSAASINEEEFSSPHGSSSSTSTSFLKKRGLQMTKTLTTSVGSYLPHSLTEIWEPERDFAWLRVPASGQRAAAASASTPPATGSGSSGGSGAGAGGGGIRTIVSLSPTMPHVMVISSDGYFYLYSIDLEKGGECALLKQYSLLDSVDVDGDGDV
ncbi:WD40 repeat-like protein [Coprinopsis sp. MPI-PUGE-AT-0042]|nr:WD40 repeat-like protein [Coprinopsis sp. MPI-PUGE-AT-0042]